MKQTNLCYILRPGEVLLAMKKRGFGAGKWNGPGGKAEAGESPEQAVAREVREEIGVSIRDAQDRGVIEFVYAGKPDWSTSCRIYTTTTYEGEPLESEEMRPQWFPLGALPYQDMWESDRVWFPQLLAGESVGCRLYFDNNVRLIRHETISL